jgi:hypothetical protein
MKKIQIGLLIVAIGLLINSCGADDKTTKANVVEQKAEESVAIENLSNKGYKLKNGLLFERPSQEALKADNPYNEDNNIFIAGRQFIYAYTHYRPNGAPQYNRPVDGSKDRIPINKAWVYQPIEDVTPGTVVKLRTTVVDGYGRMGRFLTKKDYTFIKHDQLTYAGDSLNVSQMGMIENDRNIWMPPPRMQLLNILESCPFPFIKAPYEVGNSWDWNNEVSRRFSDPRWGDWQTDEEMSYKYQITDKKSYDTKFGVLECLEVTARGGGLIGSSSLVTLFHPDYGFIRMTFKHIDGSTTVVELDEIIDQKSNSQKRLLCSKTTTGVPLLCLGTWILGLWKRNYCITKYITSVILLTG